MPYAPKKPCPASMCKNKIDRTQRYCLKHDHLDTSTKFRNKRTKTDPFYLGKPWRQTSKYYRQKNPLCEDCLEQGRMTKADVVDHTTPRQQGGADYDWDNLRSLCYSCHNRKTARENKHK